MSENKGVKSECKKFGENSRQIATVSTICDEYRSPPKLKRTSLCMKEIENEIVRKSKSYKLLTII